jgi:hypothetical protein
MRIPWQWLAAVVLLASLGYANGQTTYPSTINGGKSATGVGTTVSFSDIANVFIKDDGPNGGFWVLISNADDDLRKAKDACDKHPDAVRFITKDGPVYIEPDWRPDPCNQVERLWKSSGAEQRFADIEAKHEARELAFVKRVAGQR